MTALAVVLGFSLALAVALAVTATGWTVRDARLPRLFAGRRARREAEHQARELLRTCLDGDEWEMYRDLGFVRIWGGQGRAPAPSGRRPPAGVAYAYLLYPHQPYVVYLPQTTTLLAECRVQLGDLGATETLSASDDVLAHWMALTGDEHGVIAAARIATPGSETSRRRIRRDLWRLREWERERTERAAATARARVLEAPPQGRHAG
jgi:hypothetical protein